MTIAPGWGEKPAPTPPTEVNGASSAVCSIPVGLAVDGANRHDMKLVRTVESVAVPRPAPSPEQPQGMCLDKGYDFDEVRRTLEEFGAHIRVPSSGRLSRLGAGWWALTVG